MTKVILADGSEEFLSPGAARLKVSAGDAKFPRADSMYSTRQMTAEPEKQKRKRRTKAEIEADEKTPDESESV